MSTNNDKLTTDDSMTKPDLETKIHEAIMNNTESVFICEESPDNPKYKSKCAKLKKFVREINKNQGGFLQRNIVYHSYHDTSCAHERSGCEVTQRRTFLGKLSEWKDKLFS